MTREPITWEALEHVYYEKTRDWYWIVGTIGVTVSILSVIFSNYVFALFLFIATGTIMIHAAHFPSIVKVELQSNGIRVGSTFYPYRELNAFSLNEEHNPPMLVLDSKAFLYPDVRIFIEETSPQMVRDFLLDHLDEKYHQPSMVEGLIHYLGF